MDVKKAKRNMVLSLVAIAVSVSSIITITRNSQVRAVEFVSILACGIAIGAFITSTSLYLFLKKRNAHKL